MIVAQGLLLSRWLKIFKCQFLKKKLGSSKKKENFYFPRWPGPIFSLPERSNFDSKRSNRFLSIGERKSD